MRIDRIELHHVAMPLISPWRTAYGQDDAIESVLVCVSSGGLSIWSESTPLAMPCYSPEWAGGVFAVLRDALAPAVVGKDLPSAEALGRELSIFKGNPFAKAALDNAWWLLDAVHRGLPLHRALGAKRDIVAVGADFGVADSIDLLLEQVAQAVEAGFARVKLKYKPGWDLPMLRAVRQAFPDLTLHIDCNAGYTLADTGMFRQVDKLNLAMIEQPLASDDLLHHARLQKQLGTPICLDESINSPLRAAQAIELGSCRIINIKPGRCGGLSASLDIYRQCVDAGLGLWVGGMLESAVGASLCRSLAMLEGFTYPPDLFPSSRFYRRDLSQPALELTRDDQGRPAMRVDETPGLAAQPEPEALAACTKQHAVIRPAAAPR